MRVMTGVLALVAAAAVSAQGGLQFKAPAGWVTKPASSSMRVAQFALPRAAGDAEDAELVVYFFGAGQGGGVQANLDRWISQMQQPGGTSSKAAAKTTTVTANGLAVTVLDVTGTYAGGGPMMMGGGDSAPKPGFRMKAAVVETPKGNYFIKLTGPAKTVAKWDQSFTEFLKSVRI